MSSSPKLCGICLEEYNESERCPRILTCSHTICSFCIGSLISNNKKHCPLCRRGFNANSINDIMINYAALDFIKYMNDQIIEPKPAKKSGLTSHSSKIDKMKSEGLEANRIQLSDCQEVRQLMEDKIREIKDLECSIIQENAKIEEEILPKIQDVIIQNSKMLEELKQARIQLEDQMKEVEILQENLAIVKQKIHTTTAETFKEVGELLDEAEVLNTLVSSKMEEIQLIIPNEENGLAVKQKCVVKKRQISHIMLDLLGTYEENVDPDQELSGMVIKEVTGMETNNYETVHGRGRTGQRPGTSTYRVLARTKSEKGQRYRSRRGVLPLGENLKLMRFTGYK